MRFVPRLLRDSHVDANFRRCVWPLTALKFAFCVLVAMPISSTARTVHDELNQILDEAPDIGAFLKNEELRQRYLVASQVLWGGPENFPEVSFNAILDQVGKIIEQDPEIGRRLYSKHVLGPTFTLNIHGGANEVLEKSKWQAFLNDVRRRLEIQSKEYSQWWASEPSTERFIRAVERAQRDIQSAFERNGYTESRILGLVETYRPLISALLLYQLNREENRDRLNSDTWESVKSVTHQLATRTDLEWPIGFSGTPKLADYWKFIEPDFLRAERQFAKYGTVNSAGARSITFRSIRRFHALFRGMCVQECNGGDKDRIEMLSARRYLIPILNGAWVQFVEENGVASGFVQSVPMVNASIGQVLSVDFMASVLRQQVPVAGSAHLKAGRYSIVELWTREMQNHLPDGVIGIAESESKNGDNAGVQSFVKKTKSYILGQNLGPATTFHVVDTQMAYQISMLGWRLEKEHQYGNCLAFDGCSSDAGNLTLLNPNIIDSETVSLEELQRLWSNGRVSRKNILGFAGRTAQISIAKADPEGFKAVIHAVGLSEETVQLYFNFLVEGGTLPTQALRELRGSRIPFIKIGLGSLRSPKIDIQHVEDLTLESPEFISDLSHLEQNQQMSLLTAYLRKLTQLGRFEAAGAALEFLKKHKAALPKDTFEYLCEAFFVAVPSSLNPAEVAEIRRLARTIATQEAIIKLVAPTLSSPKHLLDLMLPEVESPSPQYRRMLEKMIFDLTPRFVALKPSATEIRIWISRSYYIESLSKIRKLLLAEPLRSDQVAAVFHFNLPEAENKVDFVNQFEGVDKKSAQAMVKEFDDFYKANWEAHFHRMTNLDLNRALGFVASIELGIKVRQWAVNNGRIKKGQEFNSMYDPNISNASEAYISALREARIQNVDFFLSLKPTISDIRNYRRDLTSPIVESKVSEYLRRNFAGIFLRQVRDFVSDKCGLLLQPLRRALQN